MVMYSTQNVCLEFISRSKIRNLSVIDQEDSTNCCRVLTNDMLLHSPFEQIHNWHT